MNTITLYKVSAKWAGIIMDRPQCSYYDTKQKAMDYLKNKCDCGEVTTVKISADYELNYFDGCTFNDLTFGDFDATEEELD